MSNLTEATLDRLLSIATKHPCHLSSGTFSRLCRQVLTLLRSEPNLLHLDDLKTVNVFGDVHGQVVDLIEMFRVHGRPGPRNPCLFLGDYVNRGKFSVELVTLLFLLKARYPTFVYLLRGNHEDERICMLYGHHDAMNRLYGKDFLVAWRNCMSCFEVLPLAAIVHQKYFCVHGGIGPGVTLQSIEGVDRRIPSVIDRSDSPLSQLLWSDPTDSPEEWTSNSRGAGVLWNESATRTFLDNNSLDMIIRGHQMVMDGYEEIHGGKVLTIFSAPNYCYRCQNLAAFVRISGDTGLRIHQMRAAERSNRDRISTLIFPQISYRDALIH